MGDALSVLVPMLAFMLIPIWIPLIAVSCGYLFDAVTRKPRRVPVDQQVRDRMTAASQITVLHRPLTGPQTDNPVRSSS